MNRLLGLTLGVAALSLSVLLAAPPDEKRARGVEKVNLSDLRDGETRTLGKGDSSVTAVRKGDVVTITYGGHDGEKKTLKCTVGKDSCYAMTVEGNGKGKIMILNTTGEDGKEADRIMLHTGEADGKGVFVFAGDGEDADNEVLLEAAHPAVVMAGGDAATGVKVIKVRREAGLLLECPEGDATLTLKKGEENSGPYFCPRHNLKMVKAKLPALMKKVEVEALPTVTADDDEE